MLNIVNQMIDLDTHIHIRYCMMSYPSLPRRLPWEALLVSSVVVETSISTVPITCSGDIQKNPSN